MGEVYLGFDPALDRRVAIKLLRPRFGESTGASDGRARLLREGQAMARLSHVNVLTVYDVGTLGEDVFIALEFLEGGTVKEWLQSRRRPWREVLDVFVRAGRGLAAAHAADVVHRDFKPGNVLIADDGQVRVMDFGLARSTVHELEESRQAARDPALDVTPGGGLLVDDLTVPGTAMGTPAYMSPEQHRGEATGARSDQFSYCVALYEGLYGERPFGGDTEEAVKEAVLAGRVREAPSDTRVPAWLRRALLPGLSVDPKDRYASMDDLLVALDRDPRRQGTRWLALAIAAFVVVASYVGFRAGRHDAGGACARSAERFDGVWDEGRKKALAQRFRSSGLVYAADTWSRVERSVDRYVAAWIEAHEDACQATRVRHEQSAELLDLRMACLAERYDQIEALLQTYAEATPAIVKDAVSLAHGLDSIDACADTERVRNRIQLPKDPRVRARVRELQGDLERARAMLEAIDREGAKKLAAATLDEIRPLGFAPLEAEALGLVAEIDERSGDWKAGEDGYYEAIRVAEVAGHEQLKAHLWIRLGASLGDRGKFDEGERCLDLAEAALGRAGGDPELQTALLKTRGVIFAERGDYEAAFENTKRAVDLYRDNVSADSLRVANLYNNLGVIRSRQGRRSEGLRWMTESTNRKRELLGPDHPMVGAALVNVGAIATDNLELDTSRQSLAEARRIYDLSLEPDDPHIGTLLVNEAALAEAEGRFEDADKDLTRAMEILEESLPADHPSLAQVIYALGMVELRLERYPEAMQKLEAALALREKLWGRDDLAVAVVLAPLARAVHGTGDRDRAARLVTRAEAILERPFDDPFGVADARFQLARALWEIDIDRRRAAQLARDALSSMEAMDDAPLRRMRELSEWLAERSG